MSFINPKSITYKAESRLRRFAMWLPRLLNRWGLPIPKSWHRQIESVMGWSMGPKE